ncbi:MAG: DEAD/DEAH box helicase family protein [Deltaproteobacteria bacterium]|jgi:hypothetical protein|nr:DEAD/DEAH box helicase family protein [Deltaproteobacteria bacterium]
MVQLSEKYFNIAGVCNPLKHYMIPAVPRLPDVREMIDSSRYFILHAPRQSGKTTCLAALIKKINTEGKYYAAYCSLAPLRNASDEKTAMSKVVNQINAELRSSEVDLFRDLAYTFGDRPYMSDPDTKVRMLLNDLCKYLDRELIVFFDEADCLHEDPLITFLTQIREGYLRRYDSKHSVFPRSMALVGMRDMRDYLSKVRRDDESKGPEGSPFNVTNIDSLTLADFTPEEIKSLYGQHTEETGQVFETDAVERVWFWTEGQPWLVNAIANDIVVRRFRNDFSRRVTGSEIDLAVHDLILRNPSHFDSLMNRLRESRVRRVIDPVIIGSDYFPEEVSGDDTKYVVDLGLLKTDPDNCESYRPSNPIYGELILRYLTSNLQKKIPQDLKNKWMDGTRLDMDGLLRAFQVYWRENSEVKTKTKVNDLARLINDIVGKALENHDIINDTLATKIVYDLKAKITDFSSEAYAHLVLFAFLQRVLNGGADFIQREYALGLTKSDICVSYKDIRYPLELKIKGVMSRDESLVQLLGYMDRCGSQVGWLVIFDRDSSKTWEERLFWETVDREGKTVHLVGC